MALDLVQGSLFTQDQVTEVTVRIGVVGAGHAQVQLEVRGADGTLVAMHSRPHIDMVTLHHELEVILNDVENVLYDRHLPF